MQYRLLLLAIFILQSITTTIAQSPYPFIHVDQFGYLPDAEKVAVISDPQVGFNSNLSYNPPNQLEIKNANTNATVLTKNLTSWNNGNTHNQSGDKGWWLDFSDLVAPGEYYIYDSSNNESSATFRIGNDVYLDVLKAATKMYYYNRCNHPKNPPYADTGWTDGLDFTNPLQDANCRYIYEPNNASLEKDLSGGWYDAGDYNKYVTFTHNVIHNLLSAYEENPQAFGDDWNIPESGNGIPDILDEIKWELDWMMKMNNADGSTHIKMGSPNYNTNTLAPPSLNTDQRFYGPICSSASITIASTFAHAAKVYDNFTSTQAFSNELFDRAEVSFSYFENLFDNNQLDYDCDDGSIVAGDADMSYEVQLDAAVIASAYLFEETGNNEYKQFFDNNYTGTEPFASGFWSGYKIPLHDAVFLYAKHPNATSSVANDIIQNIETVTSNNWDGFYSLGNNDLYRAFVPDWAYHWGSNMPKAGFGVLNKQLVENNINPNFHNGFEQKAAEQLHYFHGVNPLGLVQLSNMHSLGGEHCVNEIYHTWFDDGTDWDNALNSLYGPPPGYLTGGPNSIFSVTSLSPPSGQPHQKSYLDFNDNYPNNSWEISEPAIYYQAIYIRLLANYVDNTTVSNSDVFEENNSFSIYPNPTKDIINISTLNDFTHLEIIDINGRVVKSLNGNNLEIDVSNLTSGIYYLKIENEARKFIKL